MSNATLTLKMLKLASDIELVSARRKTLQGKTELLLANIRQELTASQARISETQGNLK